jgi:hypothetical protein
MKETDIFLEKLNSTYRRLHTSYETYFWLSYMGDHTVDEKMNLALSKRDAFRANAKLLAQVQEHLTHANASQHQRLKYWELFFNKYQTPAELAELRRRIADLENKIRKARATREEGYIDPKTKKFVKASEIKMRMIMRTEKDESLRKACFEAMELLAEQNVHDYIILVGLLNEYARALGFSDFYAYKLMTEEGMTKKELFTLFDAIYDKTKYAFKDIREMEKKMKGLRKPWNTSFMLTGDFTQEEDQYFQFDEALTRWGTSFAGMGIDFQGGSLTLDLLDRDGKWNNGFCHWPRLVAYEKGKWLPGSSNFTCNVVAGQVGAGIQGMNTLFHEGGHAAHYLNSKQSESCINTEYPPASTAWAETQSMFLDSVFSTIAWKTRYAKNKDGKAYPFDLYKRKVEKINKIIPLDLMGIMFVANFEREIYEIKGLTIEKVLETARKMNKKYFDKSEESISILNTPHIYSWESICSYHAYGLAELAVAQWQDYFYSKYGHIVDNQNIGKEMSKVWKLASTKTFKEFVILATGKNISAQAYIKQITKPLTQMIGLAQKRIKALKKVKEYSKSIQLNASIRMVDGKKEISNNKKSFEDMAEKYKKWLNSKV